MSDLLEILNGQNELSIDELEMLEADLATGRYDKDYVRDCLELINNRKKNILCRYHSKKKIEEDINKTFIATSNIVVDKNKIMNNPKEVVINKESPEVILNRILKFYRDMANVNQYIKVTEDYLIPIMKENDFYNEESIEKYFNMFKDIEMNGLLHFFNFSEAFIDKHLSSLDGEIVAETQLFSEEFYMKHYDFMTYDSIKKGKNEWRNKTKMSNKLRIFLQLKGVTL